MNYIYARQSSGEEERSISVEQQIENCKKLAASNNEKIDGVYKDLNTSGRLYWEGAEDLAEMDSVFQNWIKETYKSKRKKYRKGLGDLFKVLKDHDTIYVDDRTRLYRPLTNSYLESSFNQFIKEKQIKIVTVKDGKIDFNSFGDELINALQNRIVTNQLEIQRKKSKDSLKRLKDSGEFKQAVPNTLGYRSTGRKHEVEIDEREAEAVKLIFKLYLDGNNVLSITKALNRKYKDIFKNGKTTPKTIRDVIARPLYAGYMYDSKGELIEAQQIKGKELVDFQTWERANEILTNRKEHKRPTKKYTNFFNGITKCGYCNSFLHVAVNNKKYLSLRCVSHNSKTKDNCHVNIGQNTSYENGLGMNDAIEPLLMLGVLNKLNGNCNQSEERALKYISKQILNRELTTATYQKLVSWTIKEIAVFHDKIVVKTFWGNIELERKKLNGKYKLPKYIWSYTNNQYKLIYYYGSIKSIKEEKLLLDNAPFKAYMGKY